MPKDKSLINVENVLGIEKPILKLIDVVTGYLKPGTIRREAAAKTEAEIETIKKVSRAMRENSDMPIKYEDGKITIDTTFDKNIEDRVRFRMQNQEIKRQKNIEAIFMESANILLYEEDVSDDTLDEDWITRFFNYAQDVSEIEMQRLWSKILADEISSPGAYSLRTLEVIRNLSKKDAADFVKISEYVLAGGFVLKKDLDKAVNYSMILGLEDAGLLNGGAGAVFDMNKIDTDDFSATYGNYAVKLEQLDMSKLKIDITPLTKAGRELYKLIKPVGNIDFLKSWASSYKTRGYKVSYRKIADGLNNDIDMPDNPWVEI